MLFRYTIAALGHTAADVKSDVAKILCGETDPANLSANLQAGNCQVMDGSLPITPGREFTMVVNDGTDAVVSRDHSEFPGHKTMISLIGTDAGLLRLSVCRDYVEGAFVDPAYGHTSTSTSNFANLEFDEAGSVFYIGVTDTLAFVTRSDGYESTVITELHEVENSTVHKYDNAADMLWALEMTASYVNPNHVESNTGSNGSVLVTTKLTGVSHLCAGMAATTTQTGTSTSFPVELEDGSYGMPVHPLTFSAAIMGSDIPIKNIYQPRLGFSSAEMGAMLNVSGKSLLLLSLSAAVNNKNCVLIEGV